MPLISVVIPVHGVGDYLDRCLDSVLGEPAVPQGIEVIAVDDASPDDSAAILAARQDPRLRVIRTSAAVAPVGPGPARELGAKEAAGEYVWFVDGDDELAAGALAAVADSLTKLAPDVLIVDFENLYPDGTTSPSGGNLSGPEVGTLADHPALIHLTMTVWSKVFRRDFLCALGVSFGPAPHEDVPVTTTALLTAEKIGVLDRVCYRYRRARRGSFLSAPTTATSISLTHTNRSSIICLNGQWLHRPSPRPCGWPCSSARSGTIRRCCRWCHAGGAGSSSTGCRPISGAGDPGGRRDSPSRPARGA